MPTNTVPAAPKAAQTATPQRHHLDRRAADIAEKGAGDPDELLSTAALANWLGCSPQFLEIARSRGFGPRWCRLSSRRVRYMRSDVLAWLADRTHAATAEYMTRGAKEDGDAIT
jgi:predicted DNA-binding transcriptional regulator AlpA